MHILFILIIILGYILGIILTYWFFKRFIPTRNWDDVGKKALMAFCWPITWLLSLLNESYTRVNHFFSNDPPSYL